MSQHKILSFGEDMIEISTNDDEPHALFIRFINPYHSDEGIGSSYTSPTATQSGQVTALIIKRLESENIVAGARVDEREQRITIHASATASADELFTSACDILSNANDMYKVVKDMDQVIDTLQEILEREADLHLTYVEKKLPNSKDLPSSKKWRNEGNGHLSITTKIEDAVVKAYLDTRQDAIVLSDGQIGVNDPVFDLKYVPEISRKMKAYTVSGKPCGQEHLFAEALEVLRPSFAKGGVIHEDLKGIYRKLAHVIAEGVKGAIAAKNPDRSI